MRMWIQFNVPRIEDGNNFGVSIQEDVLSEVSGIERDALTFLDQFTRLVIHLDLMHSKGSATLNAVCFIALCWRRLNIEAFFSGSVPSALIMIIVVVSIGWIFQSASRISSLLWH